MNGKRGTIKLIRKRWTLYSEISLSNKEIKISNYCSERRK
jgi:hypothetical protein